MMQDRAGGEARVLSRSLHLYLKSGQSRARHEGAVLYFVTLPFL